MDESKVVTTDEVKLTIEKINQQNILNVVDAKLFNEIKSENESLKNSIHKLRNHVAILSWNINLTYRQVAEDMHKVINELFK